jgi:hypothetical protein
VPQFTGAEAAIIPQKGNPNIFRVSFAMAKLAKWMAEDLKTEKVAIIWAGTTPSGRCALPRCYTI